MVDRAYIPRWMVPSSTSIPSPSYQPTQVVQAADRLHPISVRLVLEADEDYMDDEIKEVFDEAIQKHDPPEYEQILKGDPRLMNHVFTLKDCIRRQYEMDKMEGLDLGRVRLAYTRKGVLQAPRDILRPVWASTNEKFSNPEHRDFIVYFRYEIYDGPTKSKFQGLEPDPASADLIDAAGGDIVLNDKGVQDASEAA